jgi:hypothetical protein
LARYIDIALVDGILASENCQIVEIWQQIAILYDIYNKIFKILNKKNTHSHFATSQNK